MKKEYGAFTPGGTLVFTEKTEKKCWDRLLEETSHMPYGSIEALKKRGYTVEAL